MLIFSEKAQVLDNNITTPYASGTPPSTFTSNFITCMLLPTPKETPLVYWWLYETWAMLRCADWGCHHLVGIISAQSLLRL